MKKMVFVVASLVACVGCAGVGGEGTFATAMNTRGGSGDDGNVQTHVAPREATPREVALRIHSHRDADVMCAQCRR